MIHYSFEHKIYGINGSEFTQEKLQAELEKLTDGDLSNVFMTCQFIRGTVLEIQQQRRGKSEMIVDGLKAGSRLTKRQQDVYSFIKKEIQQKGYSPTVREIAEGVGLYSSSTVHGHLQKMKEKGFIDWDPDKPRTLQIL